MTQDIKYMTNQKHISLPFR